MAPDFRDDNGCYWYCTSASISTCQVRSVSHCFLHHSVRVVRVVRRGRDRHLHGQVLVPSEGVGRGDVLPTHTNQYLRIRACDDVAPPSHRRMKPWFNTVSAVTTDACCRLRYARTTFTTGDGKVAKSARCCQPVPSRCFATCVMVQWTPHSQCTLAFCLRTCRRTFLSSFFVIVVLLSCSRACLLDVSRLLGLTLRLSAPVCSCHRDSLTRRRLAVAQEAARVIFCVFSSVLLNHDVQCAWWFLTAYEEGPFTRC